MIVVRKAKRILGSAKRRLFVHGILAPRTPNFRKLFESHKIVRVATGFKFTEGPVWFGEENVLLFSDIPASRIYKLDVNNKATIFREPSGNSNGLTRDKLGRLIACEHGHRRITRTEKDGTVIVVADSYKGKPLNSPNDVVVKSDGVIYFTDPPYGVKPEQQEQPVSGVYRVEPDTSRITLLVEDFKRPNGLAFSPDESRLYIDDSSERSHLRVFDVNPDGTLDNGRIFYDMKLNKAGAPDGMKVDVQGRIFCTGPGGIWVFDLDGNHLGTIVTPETPANCAWGDHDLQRQNELAGRIRDRSARGRRSPGN